MPRAKAILQSDFPYHISARCINQEWFNIPMTQAWEIFCNELEHTIRDKKLIVHNFVLMTNHFHMIVSTPEANISQAMQQFMHNTSRKLTRAGNRINESFAGRHYKCILDHPSYYLNAYKYVYRNPVKAKICATVDEYPFSTLQWIRKITPPLFSISNDFTYENDPAGTLKWLNSSPSDVEWDCVRTALRRQKFATKKDRIWNRPILTQTQII